MYYRLRDFRVVGKIPEEISRIEDLAYNLWWSWNREGRELFRRIDTKAWFESHGNPVLFLKTVSNESLQNAVEDKEIFNYYNFVISKFDDYLNNPETWFNKNQSNFNPKRPIAYFCAEFGLTEVLPIYSGGLGVLAGDHVKTASDLGLPFIGIGLLYRSGYFRQEINSLGEQIAKYPKLDFGNLPIRLVKDEKGREIFVEVRILGRTVSARIWQLNVGRVTLYLLDTDFQLNSEEDRKITNQLYGGDSYTRVSQEILLGIGGVKALRKLGIKPSVWHMNEGHSAFLGLERIREFISERELSFDQALEAVASNTLFTTHTPVPAGNDKFGFDLIEEFFNEYLEGLKISRERFLELGEKENEFNLTVLSLKLSRYHNGVSKLHGQVSQDLWKDLWGEIPPSQNPIDYVTNGIHTKTWLANELAELYTTKLGVNWEDKISNLENWQKILKISDSKLWEVKQKQKVRMIEFIKVMLQQQYEWEGVRGTKAENPELLLDPNVLTLGFARRFATYKRANLIFKDKERLKEILNHPETPIQLIFAGKAHPADQPGQEIVKEIYQLSREPEFEGKIIILENYNMKIARYLMAGVDIWLNNPRRPLEASGTSGQKAALNGVVNFSVLDGWWYEAWDKTNGWAIGKEIEFDDSEKQDLVDLNSFYDTLQRKILPAYYNKNKNGISKEWLGFVKNSIATIAPQYSTDRMVKDYFRKFYSKANQSFDKLASDNFLVADYLVNWKNRLFENWEEVKIELVSEKGIDGQLLKVGDSLEIIVKVELGIFAKEEVSVELYVAGIEGLGENTQVVKMDLIEEQENSFLYKGVFAPTVNGKFGYSARIIPKNDLMVHQYELGLAKWID